MNKKFLGRVLKAELCAVVLLSAWLPTTASFAQAPSATMDFAPAPIGPRTVSTLTIVFANPDPVIPASNLAVVDNLPAGLRIATPSNASTNCVNGLLSAPEDSTSITLSDGRIGANSNCLVTVDVTGDSAGTFMNVSGDVTSSAGNGGSASADLTISADLPVFEMSFSPGSVPFGGTSAIIYSIENTRPTTPLQSLSFRNVLPAGMVVASPTNVKSTCDTTLGPPITAQPGASEIFFLVGILTGGASCITSVDVTASVAGAIGNTTEPLMFFDGGDRSTGKASALLDVTVEQLNLSGFFSGDPVPPGESLSLDFTIDNLNRDQAASDIAFVNDLDATLGGFVALGLPMNDMCGAGSTISGTSSISLTGGSLPAQGACSFTVPVQVPGDAAPGIYSNASSEVTAEIDGRTVTGSRAMDSFEVSEAPLLKKRFLTNPLAAGQTTALEFTITNVSASNAATAIGFVDNLDQFIPGIEVADLPAAGFCGAGSTLVVGFLGEDRALIMTGGSLPPGETCTFDVTLDIPLGVPSNRYLNRTEPITATVDGSVATGKSAEAELTFVPAPLLRKSFAAPRVGPGDSVVLEFDLSYGENAPGEASDISFEDDLEATLTGLVATGLPMNDVCGAGSQLDGNSLLTLTGGTLAPESRCTFSVTLDVPDDAPTGQYRNTTSDVAATAFGLSVLSAPATAELEVTSVVLEKEFVEDPIFAGDTATLRFTITNSDAVEAATNMVFTDNLNDVLPGLVPTGLPLSDVCGAGSLITLAGANLLIFQGGSVAAGDSCSFDVSLQVPANAVANSYNNTTSQFSFTLGAATGAIAGAHDVLTISEPLAFAKAFDVDVVAPGETVSLEFTITNAHPDHPAEQLSFTDDLGQAPDGLQAIGLPVSDVCGAGSMLAGTDVITLTAGTVAPDSSCTFSVELQVPSDVATGTSISNVSSELTGTVNGFPRTAPPARDEVEVNLMTLSKRFESSAEQGTSTTLTFIIENLNSASMATGVSFADDLDAVLSGLVATGTPVDDVCGAGSVLDGSSVLTLRGGTIDPGASCTFGVTVEVPTAADPGDYENVTSALSTDQGVVADPATATLTVDPRSITDGGVDGGTDGGTDGGGSGGCGCRTTAANDTPIWLLTCALFVLWRRRLRRGQ
jgi:hypothetical protein